MDDNAAFEAGTVRTATPFGAGPQGRGSTYAIEADDTGLVFTCDYSDLVTEGFRTLRPGDRVRFVPEHDGIRHRARFVVKLHGPGVAELYGLD